MSEHILVTFPISETLLDRLRANPQVASVSYHPATYVAGTTHPEAQWSYEPPNVPDDVWPNITIHMTMFHVAKDPRMVPNLRLIQGMSAGLDHMMDALVVLVRAIDGLKVCSAGGVHSTMIAEHVVMQTLNHYHRLPVLQSIQASRKWNRTYYVPPGKLGGARELRDQTVGIMGYGCIGREVGRLFAAFGCRITVATSRGEKCGATGYTIPGTGDPRGDVPVEWYKSADEQQFKTFLQKSRILVIAAPLTPSIKNLFGAETLALLDPSTLLINVGRGQLVNQEALIDALENDRLAGAMLDVTDPEPLPENHPLWTAKNCMVTPHIAGAGFMYETRCVDLMELNLGDPKDLTNVVNVEKGY